MQTYTAITPTESDIPESEVLADALEEARSLDRNILFVGDDEHWLNIVSRGFHGTPYKPHFARSGFEALQMLETMEIDLVISDMNMPIMSGARLVKEIQIKYPSIMPVVMPREWCYSSDDIQQVLL